MITDQDYAQICSFFLSAMTALAADQVLSAITPQLSAKVNSCEEIFTVLNRQDQTNSNNAKLNIQYLTGGAGQIDNNGNISGNTVPLSGEALQKRFSKTGNFLSFYFDPLPASLDYVNTVSDQLKGIITYDINAHNNSVSAHAPAFNSFLINTIPTVISTHDTDKDAHENRFKEYNTITEVNSKITAAEGRAVSLSLNYLNTHNNSSDLSTHERRFKVHNEDVKAHSNLNSLTNYYLKSEIDSKISTINLSITNGDTSNRAYSNNLINTHISDKNAHKTLFDTKAALINPIFSQNITVNGQATVRTINSTKIQYGNNSIILNDKFLTISSDNSIILKKGNYQATLLDTSGNSRFPNELTVQKLNSTNANVTNINETDNTAIPNIGWCKTEFSNIMPYGSMPDYANLRIMQQGDVSYIWKINVPGYITVTFGHCPDIDYVIWAAAKQEYLMNLKQNTDKIFKLSEGYGNADRDQSSIFVPILPGTNTYVRLSIDYSNTNVSHMRWLFIPCMATRTYESKRNIFIQQLTQNLGNGHIDKHTTGFNDITNIFNTKADANIWIQNLS